ncbi:hypothetical protein CYMTET_11070 [Cymbomonas tetramitiformis]|uniref:Uncharacterized protein n=1 Tax=Cymbomonas tetramitiformis TaxID=36881 RepID=A0AAE0GN19_9CHLO|nr:hypothetical protein CYMTET_11070 [Cymbomonas tetramitiformis]
MCGHSPQRLYPRHISECSTEPATFGPIWTRKNFGTEAQIYLSLDASMSLRSRLRVLPTAISLASGSSRHAFQHQQWKPSCRVATGSVHAFSAIASSFDDKRVSLVQGASRGLGLEFVTQLLRGSQALPSLAGGHVVATCRNPEKAEALQELATSHPGRLTILPLDVTDEATIKAAATAVKTKLGRLDLLLNVTGVLHIPDVLTPETSLSKVTSESLLLSFQTNAMGPLLVTQAFEALLSSTAANAANSGDPVVVANLSARVGSIEDNRLGGWYSYRSSKSALNQLTRTMAVDFARKRNPVICVMLHPGTADTDLTKPFQKNVPELFTPERAVKQLLEILAGLKKEDTGKFYAWDGKIVPF